MIFFAFPSWGEEMLISHGLKKVVMKFAKQVGIFAALADKEWKKDEEKAARYILASANYATIYETVCNQK